MKGSLTSAQFSTCIADTLSKEMPNSFVKVKPMSDGGDGFLEVIKNNSGLQRVDTNGFDSLMRAHSGFYYYHTEEQTAYIELANMSGLHLVQTEEKDPFQSTTYGSGMQIKHALDNGANKIVLGLGGSATNEAGIGILYALGFSFKSNAGDTFFPKGIDGLKKIEKVYPPQNYSDWLHVEFKLIVDVQNVLLGKTGATAVYGIQKGVKLEQVEKIDSYLSNFAKIVLKDDVESKINQMGYGAAGGVAVSLSAFFNTKIMNGFDYLSSFQDLENEIKKCDFVITGEGKTDAQTVFGKVPYGLLLLSEKYNKPCILISGSIDKNQQFINRYFAYESLSVHADSTEESIRNPKKYIIKVVQLLAFKLNK
jgi:glycerate kinase